MLALTGTARRWEPKRLFSVADRPASSRLRLHLAESWPWATAITAAAARLLALPSA